MGGTWLPAGPDSARRRAAQKIIFRFWGRRHKLSSFNRGRARRSEASRAGQPRMASTTRGWVELSCQTIMPSLQSHLEGVRIVSARTRHERNGVFEPWLWKCLAFEEVVGEFYSTLDDIGAPQRRRNIVSVGDSEYEMEALEWVVAGTECCAKTVKFVERPSLEQCIQQHKLLASCVNDMIYHDGSFDLGVHVEDS